MVFELDESFNAIPHIKVLSIGGEGRAILDRINSIGLHVHDFVLINIETQSKLNALDSDVNNIPNGVPLDNLANTLQNTDMVFIIANVRDISSADCASTVAQIACEMNILTIAIVDNPYQNEDTSDKNAIVNRIDNLQKSVDTIIVMPNFIKKSPSHININNFTDFLFMVIKGIIDLLLVHGLVNPDFADIKTAVKGMGKGFVGTGIGESNGVERAIIAAKEALRFPPIGDISFSGVKGILINITGGDDMTLYDVSEATQAIYDSVGDNNETNIIFGAVTDPTMNGKIQVTIIITGFGNEFPKQIIRKEIKNEYINVELRNKSQIEPINFSKDVLFREYSGKMSPQYSSIDKNIYDRGLNPLKVLIDTGSAPPEFIADILSDISFLYHFQDGSGIEFKTDLCSTEVCIK